MSDTGQPLNFWFYNYTNIYLNLMLFVALHIYDDQIARKFAVMVL